MKCVVKTEDIIIADKVNVANTMMSRMIGLLGTSSIETGGGLIIEPCNSIHTFFMKYNIDVIFLNSKNKVIHIVENLKPWRMTGIYFKANKVIELNAGTLNNKINIGDRLDIICTN